VGAVPGFVFCARVADHPVAQFRYVAYEGPDEPEIIADTLTCLFHAEATEDTERVLDEDTHRRAYDAWDRARRHIYEQWLEATDPRMLQPKVPKTMRDAAELLRKHPPVGLTQEAVDKLIEAVEAPYAARIQRMFREAMRSKEDPARQAAAVARLAQELGLEPAPQPDPLPLIELDDVHLVCWMAIVAAEPGGGE